MIWRGFFFAIGALIALFVLGSGSAALAKEAIVRDGVADLSSWDFSDSQAVELRGQWQFVGGRLLTPEDFQDRASPDDTAPAEDGAAARPVEPMLVPVPGNWNSLPAGQAEDGRQLMGPFGAATYRLILKLPPTGAAPPLALDVQEFYTAARLYVNGEIVGGFGAPSADPTREIAKPVRRVIPLPDSGHVELIIQISNHRHKEGGAVNAPRIGLASALAFERQIDSTINLMVVGALAAMGIFYLAVFAVSRREKGFLIFSVISALAIMRILMASREIYSFWPDFPHGLLIYLEYADLYLLVPANLTLIYWLFPAEISRRLLVALWAITGTIAALGLLFPVYYLTLTREVLTIGVGVATAYGLYGIALAAMRGRQGAMIMVISGLVAGSLIGHDVLRNLQLISGTDVAAFAYITFAIGHAVVLGQRVELALAREEKSARELADMNSSLEAVVEERTRHLQQEIERRAEAEKNAARASQTKSEFLATMSHELRTPMTGVLGVVELLTGTDLKPEQQRLVDTLHSSAQSMTVLLNDILDLSRIEAAQLSLEQIDFDITRVLQDVRDLLMPRARQKGLELLLENSNEDPVPVTGDPLRLKQVLLNLAGNAIKFTDQGHVIIRLDTVNRHSDFIGLRFEVRDTGIGIPMEVQPRLFSRFTQADSSTTRIYGGSGLGLSICRSLVEMMGGAIGVYSELGRGSTFWFTVRLGVPQEDLLVKPATTGDGAAFRARHVLIADDSDVNRMLIKLRLEKAGHRVSEAGNGLRATELAAAQDFDVILMDMHMPVMDGANATRAIRQLPGARGKVSIFALTADAIHEHRQLYLSAGLDGFFTKPIDWAALDAAIAALPVKDI